MNRGITFVILFISFATVQTAAQDTIHVYLVGGQSNMVGRANIYTSDPLLGNDLEHDGIASNNILYHHNYRGSETLADDGFITLWRRPSDDGQGGNFGCELTFGRDVQLTWGLDEQIAILKYAVGGTSLYDHWYADGTASQSNDGECFEDFKSLVNEGLTKLENDYPAANIQVEGMIWHQGESDIGPEAVNYETNLTNFIHDVRQDLNVPNMPFYIGGLSDLQEDHFSDRLAELRMIVQAQKDVADNDPNSWFVSLDASDGMTISSDGVHFDLAGYKTMGERFAVAAMSPEPTTLGLLTAGGVAFLRRRREKTPRNCVS
jgi:hypothetical protein